MMDKSRQPLNTDLTSRLVLSLPATGCYVCVHSVAMQNYMKELIFTLRGKEVLDNVRVLVIDSMRGVERVTGLSGPFFIDHALASNRGRITLALIERIARANATFRTNTIAIFSE